VKQLLAVDRLEILILVDNVTDMLSTVKPSSESELSGFFKRGMRLIGWSVRGFDTVGDDIDRVAARILPRVYPGAIVVLHQGRAISARCIARVVDELRARGYVFVIPEDERLKTKR